MPWSLGCIRAPVLNPTASHVLVFCIGTCPWHVLHHRSWRGTAARVFECTSVYMFWVYFSTSLEAYCSTCLDVLVQLFSSDRCSSAHVFVWIRAHVLTLTSAHIWCVIRHICCNGLQHMSWCVTWAILFRHVLHRMSLNVLQHMPSFVIDHMSLHVIGYVY